MANDLNQCQFIGRLGADPEVKYMPNGDAVANFSIACGESWKDKNTGEKVEKTEWIRIVAWRKLGEICGEYLHKGSQVYVSGKMQTRKWDKDGQTHYTTEVTINQMQMLGGKGDYQGGQQDAHNQAKSDGYQPQPKSEPAAGPTDFDDDIPF